MIRRNILTNCNNKRQLKLFKKVIIKAIITFAFFITITNYSIAQVNPSTTFIVFEEHSTAPFSTVVLRNLKDRIQQVYVTDENGQFVAQNLRSTISYQILVKHLGYKPYSDTLIIGEKNKIEIRLKPLPNSLKEVNIRGTQGYINRVGPKLIVNVQDLKKFTNETSILGILNYAPGVIVDGGTISLNGRSGTKVLIDGRDQLNLTTQQLKTILADNVKEIEIIENPTARYDASGTGGVINIVTKKNFSNLFTDTFSPTYTRSRTNSAALNNDIIFSTDRLLINSSLSYINNGAKADKSFLQSSSVDNFMKVDDNGISNERSRYTSGSIGLDYKLTDRQTLSAGASIFHTNSDNYANSLQNYSGQNVGSSNSAIFNSYNGNEGTNTYIYFGLNTVLDTLQSTRKFFVDFTTYKSDLLIDNSAFNQSQQQLTQGSAFNNTKLISANLDYSRTLGKRTSLDYGLRYAASFLESDSQYNFTSGATLTNEYQGTDYTEQQGAAYLDFNRNYERISISLGIRAEYLYFNNQFLRNNTEQEEIDKSYFNLFPTFNINYVATDKATISIFGVRRIIRPPYSYFSPYIKVINNFSYFTGNPPALVPSFVYNIGSSLLLNHQYSVSLSYAFTDKAIGPIQYYDTSTATTIYTIGNLNNQHNLNLSVYVPVQISEKVNLRVSSAAFFNKFKNMMTTPQFKPRGSLGYYFRANAAYEVTKSLSINSTYYYLSAYQQLQVKRSERSYLENKYIGRAILK